jgi:hypothetical protein
MEEFMINVAEEMEQLNKKRMSSWNAGYAERYSSSVGTASEKPTGRKVCKAL